MLLKTAEVYVLVIDCDTLAFSFVMADSLILEATKLRPLVV